jgi:response regulator RpfG family c-di-GMP phosphodiesterase
MNSPADLPEMASMAPARILFVDDEPNILSSLRRLFRSQGYQVLTAESGKAGLAILETEAIDLIISDMRMPEMDGAQFLEHVRASWPDTIRLLLTGYSDIQSILAAINRGEIYRYITKPWDDNDIVLVVRHALERRVLEHEKKRLETLAQQQNEELKALNASLETKVSKRTAELTKANNAMVELNGKLKASFLTSIKVFSNVIEIRGGNLAGHSRRVADLARKIAVKMELAAPEVQEIFVAGLLHDIGKIAFSDDLLVMPVSLMKGEQLNLYRKHPVRAEQLLMPLDDLRGAATILRSQLERFDGEGSPDGLSGFNIPIGARILSIASDYDNLQIGTLVQRQLRSDEALPLILQARGKRYDPQIVNVFQEIISGKSTEMRHDIIIDARSLLPGMVISRDLLNHEGFLLLSAENKLNERLIRQIIDFETAGGAKLTIYIHPDRSPA